jgi:hypothetical protein
MNRLLTVALRPLLVTLALIAAGDAARGATTDTCQLYGYVPHTRDYAVCRANLRYYWNTGPCADSRFVAAHRWHCHAFGIL